jgi:hypothetical protein
MRWSYFFAIFIMSAAYAGQIITTNDFSDIEIECSSLNKNSLLLFDVDATNEMPCDLNLELGRFQVNFFVENDVWLSDKEGLDILSNHPEHCQIK